MYGTRDIALNPTLATAFAPLEDVKTFLGVSGSGQDAVITALIFAASQSIEGYCGTIFTQRTVTEAMFPEDSVTNLILSQSPVIALTSLHIDDVEQTLADHRVMKELGAVRRNDGSTIYGEKLVAVYTAGYATIPPAIVEATKHFVKALLDAKEHDGTIQSESVPDVGSTAYKAVFDSVAGVGGVRVPVTVAALVSQYARNFGV